MSRITVKAKMTVTQAYYLLLLLNEWVSPFRKKGSHHKMMSYQYSKNDYHVITIIIIDDVYVERNSGQVDILMSEQYLLTVKNEGALIDGLKVAESLSKDHLDDDFVDGNEIMSKKKWAEFKQDTAKVYDLTAYLKGTVVSEREDYIDGPQGKEMGVLETLLQEEFEGRDETIYLIDSVGKIKKIAEKKGALRKISENTGERIKI